MQIVIEIPEERYERFKKYQEREYFEAMISVDAIANGIPLHKGHGRLVDVKEILDAYKNSYKGTHADDLSAFLSEYVQTVIPEEKEKNERETKSKEIKER